MKHFSRRTGLCIVISVLCLFFSTSYPSYFVGNIFFGKYPPLYNVNLAQFFFFVATHPVIGSPAPFAYHQRSRTEFIKGNLHEALTHAEEELRIYPEHNSTYYIIGLTYGYLGQEYEAIDAFKKFIAASPHSWAARNDCAWLQFRTGDIDGALETITPVATRTTNPWVQNTYGTLLMNKKRYTEARTAFLHAQQAADAMDKVTWGKAYPGNDPRVYGTGLAAMKASIARNLQLIETKK